LDVVELLDLVLFAAYSLFAVPVPVAPLRMRVADAAHAEGEQWFELDAFLASVVAEHAQRCAFRPAHAARPSHFGNRPGEVFDARVVVPRRIGRTDDVEQRLTADDAVAVPPF